MKRLFAALLVLALSLVPLSAYAGNDYADLTERTILRRGMRGDEVTRFQNALIRLGYLVGPADGFYGPETEDAVAAFQRRNGFAGQNGYSGVGTLFTQAVLYGDRNIPADVAGAITGTAGGQYSLKRGNVRTLGQLSAALTFTNEDIHSVEALCFVYWLSDAQGRVVNIGGQDYYVYLLRDANIAPGSGISFNAVLPATEKELARSTSLRFIVAEIAYTNGSVYVDYNAALAPYESDYFVAASWS